MPPPAARDPRVPSAAWSARTTSAARAARGNASMPVTSEPASPCRHFRFTTTFAAIPDNSSRSPGRMRPEHDDAAGRAARERDAGRTPQQRLARRCARVAWGCRSGAHPPAASRTTHGRAIIARHAQRIREPASPATAGARCGSRHSRASSSSRSASGSSTAASTTTVFVMRHAEKLTVNPDDPDPALAPAGEARALELAQHFGRAPKGQSLDAIIVTELRRTQDTVRPLANRLGIPVIVVKAEDPAGAAKRALSEYRGGRVLIVGALGHGARRSSGTVAAWMSGRCPKPITESSTWWRCRASAARPSRASTFPSRDRALDERLVLGRHAGRPARRPRCGGGHRSGKSRAARRCRAGPSTP